MKQMETHSVTIGENVFYIRPLPAFRAANLSGELAGVLIPILASLAPLLGSELDADLTASAPTISQAFSALSGDKVEALLKRLLISERTVSIEIKGKAQLLTEDLANEIFCSDVQNMFQLAFEVLRTNYSGFFAKIANQFGPVTERLTAMKE